MNLHPIIVHFPIALLTVYSLMELLRFKKLLMQTYWFYTKALFVMIGGLGALAAAFTGDMAKRSVIEGKSPLGVANFRQVVSMHNFFAYSSIAIFGIIALCYLVAWLDKEYFYKWFASNPSVLKVWKWKVKIALYILNSPIIIILALAGLICITITGGLGGVMVYGTGADPFFEPIYKLLFP